MAIGVKSNNFLAGLVLAAGSLTVAASAALSAPKVILLIGDGMDANQVTLARNYLEGARGQLVVDKLPWRSSVQVLTVSEDNPQQVVYVADSANSATAIATGQVTSIGRVSTLAGSDRDVETLAELAVKKGIKTGLVTTAEIVDATVAAFASHVAKRDCKGPDDMGKLACRSDRGNAGGPGSIAEQLLNSNIDLLLGGGASIFAQINEDGETLRDVARKRGISVVDGMQKAREAKAGRLLGLFADSHLPVRWAGPNGAKAEAPEPDERAYPIPFSCVDNPAYGNTPSLAAMTRLALNRLDGDAGFFLMVESASIDKQAHVRNPCGQIGEMEQLDEALAVALKFAKADGDTLILVTADHGHSMQIVPAANWFAQMGYHRPPGYFARLITRDDAVIGVAYGTTDSPLMETHTGVSVPLYGYGPEKARPPAYLHQTELFNVMRDFLGLESSGDAPDKSPKPEPEPEPEPEPAPEPSPIGGSPIKLPGLF